MDFINNFWDDFLVPNLAVQALLSLKVDKVDLYVDMIGYSSIEAISDQGPYPQGWQNNWAPGQSLCPRSTTIFFW